MSLNEKSILILGCFDTKGDIFTYLRDCILSEGESVITISTGIYETSNLFPIDFDASLVASEVGYDLLQLRREQDRGKAIDVMGRGASSIISKLIADGKVKGAIGMGGGGGTYISLAAMQQIPFGIPKVCVSTVASKDLSRQIGDKDITLVPSVVDVAGTNHILKQLVLQAAAAVCAMAHVGKVENQESKGCIAISMFGNTTACVDKCTELLNKEGFEVLAFHATGVGGKTMEALIREGVFVGVLDVTTTELADDLCDGICSAGPTRLTAATDMGLPQVVVPGCLDMVNFAHLDTVPIQYKDRQLYSWAPDVTLMRTNADENQILGQILAERVSKSRAPAKIILPRRGISQIDREGGFFYNSESNTALFDSIKKHSTTDVIDADLHINDPEFSEILVSNLLSMLKIK